MLATLVAVWALFRVISWTPLAFTAQDIPRVVSMPHALADAAPGGDRSATLAAPDFASPVTYPRTPLSVAPHLFAEPLPAPALPSQVMGDPLVAGGHQLLWMAGLAQLPVPNDVVGFFAAPTGQGPAVPAALAARRAQGERRWSVDGWLFLRQGGGSASAGAFVPSYGAGQAGAVIRYRLVPDSGHRPALYMRGYKALRDGGEAELAAGFAARPVPAVPVVANGEVRATDTPTGTRLRPAAFVNSELAPARLPLGVRAEAYGQAGYVGGAGATAFADGQLRVDRQLARFDLGEVRAGVGSWGGAQKGAARVDIGPAASVELKLGDAPARISVDYRVRVAGDASPGSGVAVTLSTGF